MPRSRERPRRLPTSLPDRPGSPSRLMRLLYLDHYAGGPALGMEHRPFYLAREWVRLGHQVLVVGASYSHLRTQQPATRGRYTREVVDGVEFVWIRTPAYPGNGVRRVLNIAAFLYGLRRWRAWLEFKPDVVIASSTYPADATPARQIARACGARFVWEVHDLWPLSPIELGGMSRRNPFIAWMQREEDAACRGADVVVSILPLAEAHLNAHGLTPGKFAYIPNGVDPGEWVRASRSSLPVSHAAVIAAAHKRGHLIVTYAGSHTMANDLNGLLDAARLMRDDAVTWFLVGSGPDKPALVRRVAAEQLDNVILMDPVPKSAIPELLEASDLLYMGLRPSPLYRFGISLNKLVDYLMAARPVLCVMSAGNDPVTEVSCGITVAPGHPEAIVQALRTLADLSATERSAMGSRGRSHVLASQTYPILARQFLDAAVQNAEARKEDDGSG